MSTIVKIPQTLCGAMRQDLTRAHHIASERVGFAYGAIGRGGRGGSDLLVLITRYVPVADENYKDDPAVCARINSAAIRAAMQGILDHNLGGFHVHFHGGYGIPRPSGTDRFEIPKLVRSFRQLAPKQAHGFLVLSNDSVLAVIWRPGSVKPIAATKVVLVGWPMVFARNKTNE